MASYTNPYNVAIANHQRRLNIANLKNDFAESLQQPLHGGGMSGGDFWSDFSDGFMSVWNPIIDTAGKVAPFLPLLGLGEEGVGLTHAEMSGGDMSVNAPYIGYKYGDGMSGGEERSNVNQPYIGGAIPNEGIPPFNEITNAGMSGGSARDRAKYIVKQNDYCCLRNKSNPMPCNGQPLPKAQMQAYLRRGQKYREGKLDGDGMSGGDEIRDTDHPVKLNPELQATMFLGGRKPSSVSKKQKIGMVQQVIADMIMKNKLKGRGYSGGDFWSDLGDTFSKVAPFLPLLGLGESGGAMTYEQNMNMADAMGDIFSGMGQSGGGLSGGKKAVMNRKLAEVLLKKQLKNLHGRGMSGGDFDWSSLLSFAPLLLGLGMSGGNVDLNEIDELKPLVLGLGMSGGDFWDDLGKGFSDAWSWITDTAIPAITPVIDTAGKVADVYGKVSGKKEGKGVSGGDFWSDLGNTVSTVAPFLPLLGLGESGGRQGVIPQDGDYFSDLSGLGQSGGARASDTRMKSGKLQLYKSGNGLSGGLADRKVGGKRGLSKQQRLALKIAHLQGKGLEPTSDIEKADALVGLMARANPKVDNVLNQIQSSREKDPEPPHAKGLGVSGGKKVSKWILHVKEYAKKHNLKYGDALKQAKATYRG